MNDSSQRPVFWWQPACFLRVTGADAATFLQGQFTNDLRQLTPEKCTYGLWLNVKGKIVADSFVIAGAEGEHWILSTFCPASTIKERLESFIIADDVVVEDSTAGWRGVTVFGSEAKAWVTEQQRRLGSIGYVFDGRRDRAPHVEWIFPSDVAAQVHAVLHGGVEFDVAEMERRRIEAGIPAVPRDIGPSDLPNEGGLEESAISYNKGCYLGQEVMARLKSMGQIRRRLGRVGGDVTSHPALPAPIFAAGRQVGELRSAATRANEGWIGLAMVSLLHVKLDTPLAFAPDGAPALRLLDTP